MKKKVIDKLDMNDLEDTDIYPNLDTKRMIMDFELQKKINELIDYINSKEKRSA